jgi:hypothetical protein
VYLIRDIVMAAPSLSGAFGVEVAEKGNREFRRLERSLCSVVERTLTTVGELWLARIAPVHSPVDVVRAHVGARFETPGGSRGGKIGDEVRLMRRIVTLTEEPGPHGADSVFDALGRIRRVRSNWAQGLKIGLTPLN